jgi:hypothetical protein
MNPNMIFSEAGEFRLVEGDRSEKGIALVVSLFALSVLTLIGLTMTFVSTTEILINRNNRINLLNLYGGESGTEEARERIRPLLETGLLSLSDSNLVVYIIGNPSINPTSGNADTNPYYDPDYSPLFSNRLVSSNLGQQQFAWVKILQKTESRAGYNLDNSTSNNGIPVFYGYNKLQPNAKPSQYVNSGTQPVTYVGSPVYLVTTLAKDNAGYKQVVRADMAATPVPPLSASLYSKDMVSVAAQTVVIDGKDENGTLPNDLIGLESQKDITGDVAKISGTPLSTKPYSAFSYNIDSLVKTFKPPIAREIEKVAPAISKLADGTYVGDGLSLGQIPTEGDLSQAAFANGPLNISNTKGQGILVVDGDLLVTGTFLYYGLIIVRGKIYLNGGAVPGIEIHGAVIASSHAGDQSSLLMGNVKILNNSYFIQRQFNSLGYVRVAYREIL